MFRLNCQLKQIVIPAIEKLNNQLFNHIDSLLCRKLKRANSWFALEKQNCITFQRIVMNDDNERLIQFELAADYHYTSAPSWEGVTQSIRYGLALFWNDFN